MHWSTLVIPVPNFKKLPLYDLILTKSIPSRSNIYSCFWNEDVTLYKSLMLTESGKVLSLTLRNFLYMIFLVPLYFKMKWSCVWKLHVNIWSIDLITQALSLTLRRFLYMILFSEIYSISSKSKIYLCIWNEDAAVSEGLMSKPNQSI